MVRAMNRILAGAAAVAVGALSAVALVVSQTPDEAPSAGARTHEQCADLWSSGVRAEGDIFYRLRLVYDPTNPADPRRGTPEGERLTAVMVDVSDANRAFVDRVVDSCRSEVR